MDHEINILERELIFENKYLKKLMNIFYKYSLKPRLIGGSVRDNLLQESFTDIDIIVPITPEKVMEILKRANIKVIPTGLKYGTVTCIIGNEEFEITSLRKDIECYGRDVKVEFTEDFQEDALRRDFTINALSYCYFDKKIYDYTTGIKDLDERKVKFIGNPENRIKEDYLRILRFFRFSAKFSSSLDEQGFEACIRLKERLKLLSRERITKELDKILLSSHPEAVVTKMSESGIFEAIESDFKVNIAAFARAMAYIKTSNLPDEHKLILLYSTLLSSSDHGIIQRLLMGLRFPKKLINSVLNIIEISQARSKELQHKIYLLGFKSTSLAVIAIIFAVSTGLITPLEYSKLKFVLQGFSSEAFPINGHDILNMNIAHKEISSYLKTLQIKWVESNFLLNKDQLLKMIQNDKNIH